MQDERLGVKRVLLALYQEKGSHYRFRGERHRGLHEIFCLDRGKAFVRIGSRRFHAEPGDCFLYPPGEFHQHQATHGQAPHYLTIVFSLEGGALLKDIACRRWQLPPHLRTLLARVVSEDGQALAGVPLQRALLTVFLIEWLRHARSLEAARAASSAPPSGGAEAFREKAVGEVVARALQYLETHFAKDAGMENVARAAMVSAPYLRQLARARLGHSLRDELMTLRIRRAKHLLSHTGQSIKEVARSVGYRNDAAFSRAFRKIEGVTPSDYSRTVAARGATPLPK